MEHAIPRPRVPSHPADVLALQRAVGNRGIAAMLAGRPQDRPTVQRLWSSPAFTPEAFDVVASGVQQSRTRVKSVEATLGPKTKRGTGPEAPTALRGPGDVLDPDAATWDRGHVIALDLGGTNVASNVVPMGAGFNRVVWRAIERELLRTRNRVTGLRRGIKLRARIEAQYGGPDPRIPTQLSYVSELSKPVPGLTPPSGTIAVQGPAPRTNATTALAEVAGLSAADAEHKRLLQPTAPLTKREDLEKVAAYKQAEGLGYPVGGGPYGYLDFHAGWVGYGKPATGFNPAQRLLILNANRARNGGQLKSDDPKDPHQILNEGEDDARINARVEIDHVVPKSKGGGSYFANARAVSWEMNNRTSRVKSTVGLIDPMKVGSRYRTRQSVKLKPLGKAAVYAVEKTGGVVRVKEIVKFIEANSPTMSVNMVLLQKELNVAVQLGLLTKRSGGYVRGSA